MFCMTRLIAPRFVVFELASFLQKSFIDYSLFSESEKNELNQFLNEFEDNGSRKNGKRKFTLSISF